MTDQYPEVFHEELDTMKGMKTYILVPENAIPRYFEPKPWAYALQGPVVRKFERLQVVGTIAPVTHSEWVALIVPIVNTDGSIRICGDSKITVNQNSKLDSYPSPKTEVEGGQKFTKLDLSHGYQQLLLDKETRKYIKCTGLFMYTKLSNRISSPGIFQRVMENLLAGITYEGETE